MKSISIDLYKFNELSEEAKKTAIEKERNSSTYLIQDWYEFVFDNFKEKAKEAGFDVEKMYFNLSYSQRDYAMFEGSIIKEKFNTLINNLPINKHVLNLLVNNKIDYSWSYGKNTVNYDFDYKDSRTKLNDQMSSFGDFIENRYDSLCKELYKDLQKEYEYLISDEAIGEHLEINEYDFTEKGKIYFEDKA